MAESRCREESLCARKVLVFRLGSWFLGVYNVVGETISGQLYEHILSCQLVMSTIREEAGQRAKEG